MIKLLEHTRRHDLSFHRNGTIRIAANVARILSLHPGVSINIAESNGEYLLYAVHHPNSNHRCVAKCYRSKRGAEHYCANSVRLCRALFKSIGVDAERISYLAGDPIEKNGVTYVPIITLHPL